MSVAGLSEMPPVSKVMPLPTSTTGGCFLHCAVVLEHDEPRRLIAAVGDRQERAHLQLFDLRALQHLALEAKLLRQRLRALSQIGRSADVAGQVAQISRQVHAMGDSKAAGGRRFAGGKVAALGYRERQLAQRTAYLRRLAFHLVEAIDRFHRDHDRMLDPPRDFAALDLFFGQVDDGFVGAGFVEEANRCAHRAAELPLTEIALLAQSDEQERGRRAYP